MAASPLSGLATARREFARSLLQGCFLRAWRSPFVRGTAKQRPYVRRAAVMRSAKASRQASPVQVKSRANLRMKWADWRPLLLVLRARVMRPVLLRAKALLVPQDWQLRLEPDSP